VEGLIDALRRFRLIILAHAWPSRPLSFAFHASRLVATGPSNFMNKVLPRRPNPIRPSTGRFSRTAMMIHVRRLRPLAASPETLSERDPAIPGVKGPDGSSSNNAGVRRHRAQPFCLETRQIKKMISSYVGRETSCLRSNIWPANWNSSSHPQGTLGRADPRRWRRHSGVLQPRPASATLIAEGKRGEGIRRRENT